MSSLLPGFEYDIFISYRQNDNRSGWVTEFVKSLKEEVAATIKEPVSIYYDSNPDDGLLETHNVDKSLENKLKTIIFIPILSQTYCDTKSFAWQNEFRVFNKLAKEDYVGRDVKLNTGNVASRILPVKIHELDADDKALLEEELGGFLRAIEFIFKTPGVNRPLTPTDKREENINRTFYRDQINKVANAIKEIIVAVNHSDNNFTSSSNKSIDPTPITKSTRWVSKKVTALLAVLAAVAVVGYFIFKEPEKKDVPPSSEKSIAVLPFVNMSDDKEQEYFSDGLTEEILNRLAGLPQLTVMARTSSFAFKGKNLPIQKIADSLGVAYVVEGSVRRADKKLKITVQLIRRTDGAHIWSKTYDQILDDIFKIQEDIAGNVARSLDIYLDEQKKEMMFFVGTRNVDAYENFLKGKTEFFKAHSPEGGSLWKANSFFKRALEYDSTFAAAYWYQHDAYMHALFSGSELLFALGEEPISTPESYLEMNALINSAIDHARDTSIQNTYKLVRAFYSEDWTNLRTYADKFVQNKSAPKMMAYSETVLGAYSLILLGKGENLYEISSQALNYDPLQPSIWMRGTFGAVSSGQLGKAEEFIARAKETLGENYKVMPEVLIALGRSKELLTTPVSDAYRAIALCRDGQLDKAKVIADSLYSATPMNELLIWVYDELKNKERANQLASKIDKVKLGNVRLSMMLNATSNLDHLVFDLKSTPNFARRLEEAGIDLDSLYEAHQ